MEQGLGFFFQVTREFYSCPGKPLVDKPIPLSSQPRPKEERQPGDCSCSGPHPPPGRTGEGDCSLYVFKALECFLLATLRGASSKVEHSSGCSRESVLHATAEPSSQGQLCRCSGPDSPPFSGGQSSRAGSSGRGARVEARRLGCVGHPGNWGRSARHLFPLGAVPVEHVQNVLNR